MSDSPAPHLESRVRRKDDVPWKKLDDLVVVLDLSSGDFFELDEVASLLWNALDGARTLAGHAQMLVDVYGIDVESARSDVIAFISELDSKGLVVIAG